MKISLAWLNDHVDLAGVTVEDLDALLTFAGVEVEGIEEMPENVVVGKVVHSEKHPDADKLSVCMVEDGSGTPRQVVCGAKNYAVGDNVPLALPGSTLPGDFHIKTGKLRGVESHGMLCSASELGLGDAADGLYILPEDLSPGTPLAEIFPAVFDLEITPNRPDLLSHRGIARETATLLDRDLAAPSETATLSHSAAPDGEVEITAPSHCPFYSAIRIANVKVGPSPQWLCDKLVAVGLRPINNVVDITNFVLMETGQPLHAFDAAQLDGGIVVRLAAEGEKFVALDEATYSLKADDVVIADQSKAVALGGVMGGEHSGVTESTTDVVLESAWFTPPCIRRTSRRLNLSTDSSYRFERGVDPAGVLEASRLATRLIAELAGGEPAPEIFTDGEPPAVTSSVVFDEDRARALLGADLTAAEMHRILTGLGLAIENQEGVLSTWHIPSYRLDLSRHIDLVEEVARVHGLDKIPATLSAAPAEESPEDVAHDLDVRLRARLTAAGFFEARTLKLISSGQLQDHLLPLGENTEPVALKNPLSDEHSLLRPGLTPGLLAVAERNVHQGATSLRLFEIGTVFQSGSKGGPTLEDQQVGILLGGDSAPASWHRAQPAAVDFSDLRGLIESLLPGISVDVEPVESPSLALGAKLSVKGREIGRAGQVWPKRVRSLDFGNPVYVAELSREALHSLLSTSRSYTELARFPAVVRDIAMEVPSDLPNAALKSFFTECGEPLLESAELFDVFVDKSGVKLSSDKKSLAYSLTYRDKTATLTSEKVDEAHAKILDSLVKELPVQIR